MFLGKLSGKEKEAFISLSVHASKSNDVFAQEEKMMIHEYCKEMDIPTWNEEDILSIDEIVAVFKSSELPIKKIVLLETLGLLYSDGTVDENEKEFIKEYAEKIGLTEDIVEKQTVAIKEYLDALKKVTEAIA